MVSEYKISRQIRRKHSGNFNKLSDQKLSEISLQKRKGVATQTALLAQEILWIRNGSSDTSWKEILRFRKFVEDEEY